MNKIIKIFEDLDYVENFETDQHIIFRKDSSRCLGKGIDFHKPTKTVEVGGSISMKELNAICEFCKEKGWLDVK